MCDLLVETRFLKARITLIMPSLLFFLSKLFRIWSINFLFWSFIFERMFCNCTFSLHLMNEFPRTPLKAADNFKSDFSLRNASLFCANALSATDLTAPLIWVNTFEMRLHFSIVFLCSLRYAHLMNIFFLPAAVMLVSWMTALFLRTCAASLSSLNASKVLLRVLLMKSLKPFSNLFALLSLRCRFLYGKPLISLKAVKILPALDCKSLLMKPF